MRETNSLADAEKAIRTFNRYQVTEYNTAINRSRTAKQWNEFNDPEHKDIFPNLQWIASRSVTPREAHRVFWGRIWSKDDPFWNKNQPGSLWNCKCDWIETNKPVTDNTKVANSRISHKGLEGNPAQTRQIFTDNASYIANTSEEIINEIAKCYYRDSKSKVQISVMPDLSELSDNIKTGRILAENKNVKDIEIRPHFLDQTEKIIKNPEYKINDSIADAKRIEGWKVASAFRSAKKQGCRIIIIDLKKMEKYELNTNMLSRGIANRKEDFIDKKNGILDCYIVYKEESVKIGREMFEKYNNRDELIQAIEDVLSSIKK